MATRRHEVTGDKAAKLLRGVKGKVTVVILGSDIMVNVEKSDLINTMISTPFVEYQVSIFDEGYGAHVEVINY